MERYRVLTRGNNKRSSWSFIQEFKGLRGRHTWSISKNPGGQDDIEVNLDTQAKIDFFETFPDSLEHLSFCAACGASIL